MKKKLNHNACCARCKKRGAPDGDFYNCTKKGRVRASFVCKKYEFDPFAVHYQRPREFDASMFDPLDFEIE